MSKCRSCKGELVASAPFCPWCGRKVQRDRQPRSELSVPEPRQLPSGAWHIYLRREGVSITEDTPEMCVTKAMAARAGLIRAESQVPYVTLAGATKSYIDKHRNSWSPSTLAGYVRISGNRFVKWRERDARKVDWARAINEELETVSRKTVANAWAFCRSALRDAGVEVDVDAPAPHRVERPYLTPEQIPVFLAAMHGRSAEVPALLALHSLRLSELAALTWEQVDMEHRVIHVSGAIVMGVDGLVAKPDNKTRAADRYIPIMIPRLTELLEQVPPEQRIGRLWTMSISRPYKSINAACQAAGLPEVGVHGLRHSFASLAHRLRIPIMDTARMGGWDDLSVLQRIYTHLDDVEMAMAGSTMAEFYKKENATTLDE